MNTDLLCALIAALAFCAILCDREGRRHRAFYALKPLTTVAIIGLALSLPEAAGSPWLMAGLGLCLMGDIALLGDSNRHFIAGLSSFLLGHLLLIPALLLPLAGPAWPPLSGLVVVGTAFMLMQLLPHTGVLKLPVLLYSLVLTGLAIAALTRGAHLDGVTGWLAGIGGLLFALSDGVLGWRRFRGPFPGSQAVVLATYWGALTTLVLSFA